MSRIYARRPGNRGEVRDGKGLPSPSTPIQAKAAGPADPDAVERAARLGHNLSQLRIGSGRPRTDRGRSLPSHSPGCGCPSCAGRRRSDAEAPVAASTASTAADSGSEKAIQLCRICGNPACNDPSRHVPPTVDQVMATVDPRAQIQSAMATADARYQFQAANAPAGPHLFGSAEVRGVDRRTAVVQEPRDRLVLSAENRADPTDPHYTQLLQSPGPAAPPLVAGRFQDPTTRNAPPTERHIFEQGARGAPSYPREASQLRPLAAASPNAPFAQLEDTMMVQPIASAVPDEAAQRHLMTAANIVGIAEQRRDPYMGMASAQTIVHAARAEEPPSLPDVFGVRQGRVNLPGLLPASGTGAAAAFREFRADLQADQPPSTPASQRLSDNISEQHVDLMRQSIDPQNLQRMADRGFTDIPTIARVRAESAATRQAAMMTGQLPYGLRSLLPRPPSSSEEDDL